MPATFLLILQAASTGAVFPQGLSLPVTCVIGRDCLVEKLVDLQPGPGRRDYRCGLLTTEDHRGIDIRVRTMADMARGVAVVAAAAGKVARVRDGEADVVKGDDVPSSSREAGNAVVIDHGSGWETQYSHLRRGSVAVHPGQSVRAGDRLGAIGLSGNTEYPHLHFEVRHNGATIDPFTRTSPPSACSSAARQASLWSDKAARSLTYQPTAVIVVGFSSSPPDKASARAGELRGSEIPANADAIILWADAIGAAPGDIQHFTIVGPGGRQIYDQRVAIEEGGLSWFGYAGRRRPAQGWPRGQYRGRYELARDGRVIASAEGETVVR